MDKLDLHNRTDLVRFALRKGVLPPVGAESTLPGGKDERFVHVPLPVLFLVAPVMGGLFAIFLPFIGFAMTFYGAGKKVAQLVGRRSAKLAQS